MIENWAMFGLLGLNTLAQIAKAGDTWVHQQTEDGDAHGRAIDMLQRRMDQADDRSSRNQSRVMDKVGQLELDIRELMTMARAQGHGGQPGNAPRP